MLPGKPPAWGTRIDTTHFSVRQVSPRSAAANSIRKVSHTPQTIPPHFLPGMSPGPCPGDRTWRGRSWLTKDSSRCLQESPHRGHKLCQIPRPLSGRSLPPPLWWEICAFSLAPKVQYQAGCRWQTSSFLHRLDQQDTVLGEQWAWPGTGASAGAGKGVRVGRKVCAVSPPLPCAQAWNPGPDNDG